MTEFSAQSLFDEFYPPILEREKRVVEGDEEDAVAATGIVIWNLILDIISPRADGEERQEIFQKVAARVSQLPGSQNPLLVALEYGLDSPGFAQDFRNSARSWLGQQYR